MKAVLLSKFAADIPSIKPIETPIPTPKPGQVLIRVTHVAPTFGDGLVATGKYQTKPPFPFIPGTECSGVVVGVGEGVQRFKAGMRVIGFNNPGGPAFGCWTEFAVFPASDPTNQSWLYETPPLLTNREAVATLANYATALYGFNRIGGIPFPDQPVPEYERPVKERIVLVHGGAGGMGTSSIHLAKYYIGVGTVIATVSTPEKGEIAKNCGADFVVDYSKDSWISEVRAICKTRVPAGAPDRDIGVDCVIETVGNTIEGSIKCARWGCRILVIGFAGGEMPKIKPNVLLVKGISIAGCWLGGVTDHAEWSEINTRVLVDCFGLPSSSPSITFPAPAREAREPLFRPVIYPGVFVGLDSISAAIGTMHGRKGYGKVVVDVVGEDPESKGQARM